MGLPLALLYAAIFAFLGLNTPFWPVWLARHGMDAPAIGLIVGASAIVKIVAQPALGLVADTQDRRQTLIWIALAGAALFSAYAGAESLALLLGITLAAWVFIGPLVPFTDALTLSAPVNYGRIRLFGSLAFIGGNYAGGALLDHVGVESILWAQVAALVCAAAAAASLPRRTTTPAAPPRRAAQSFARLASAPLTWVFVLSAALTNASHGLLYSLASVHWGKLGYSGTTIGIFWAIGVGAEVLLFFLAGGRVSERNARLLLVLGGAGAVIRWTAMAFNPGLAATVLLQLLHGLTYGAMHLGAMFVIRLAVRREIASAAQGGYTAIVDGLVIGLAQYASGPLYAAYAGEAYFAMAALGAGGLAFSLLFALRWKGAPLDPSHAPA